MRNKVVLVGLMGVVLVAALTVFVVALTLFTSTTHANPPVLAEPAWDSPKTRELAQRACFDCHSNETAWPWYSNVPFAGQLITYDVLQGRRELNFSEWSSRFTRKAREANQQITRGEMPPANYLILHPTAKLTADEKQQLINGLLQSLK